MSVTSSSANNKQKIDCQTITELLKLFPAAMLFPEYTTKAARLALLWEDPSLQQLAERCETISAAGFYRTEEGQLHCYFCLGILNPLSDRNLFNDSWESHNTNCENGFVQLEREDLQRNSVASPTSSDATRHKLSEQGKL